MSKILLYSEDGRKALILGIEKVANAVRVTLGPKGKNVLLQNKFGPPIITNDGVTIAKEIDLKDPFENMGAQLLKEVASKTNDIAGDGTTTATILGHAIFKEGLKNVVAGANAMDLKRGIKKAIDFVVENLKNQSQSIETKESIAQVASISANNDKEIGELIADAMDKVGRDGVVTIEDSKGIETELDIVEGMEFDNGFISPYMITDKDRKVAEFDDPLILLTNQKISSISSILPLLDKIVKAQKSLVIISDGIEGEALSLLLINNFRGTFKSLAVKAPGFGDRRKEILEDLAVLTGGEVITEEKGLTLETLELNHLGSASKVKASKDFTTIVNGKGKDENIKERINNIKNDLDNTESMYDREKLQERLARMAGGVAIIKVGATTETELKEKKHRVEDALSATRAAVEEGIVAGGGKALINAYVPLKNKIEEEVNNDIKLGMSIVLTALQIPAEQIALNAGVNGSIITNELKALASSGKFLIGYDAKNNKFVDMLIDGIIDPVKVTRSAIQNAGSIASMLLTTEVLVVEDPEDIQNNPQMPQGI